MKTKQTQASGQRKSLFTSASLFAAAAAALTGAPAMAQSADEDEAIVVTGTRIPQANLYTTSPVTQVTAEDITTQGVTRVEDLISQLPQAFAAQNSSVSNGASGTATVSLRGLGSSRTLVLIDGRRMPYGSPRDDAADLNQIPGQLVDRVEILTGGASAVYGSDAIGGVVNFIMKKDFEGLRFDAQYGFYQHNNDFDGDGFLRQVIAARGITNPAAFRLPEENQDDGFGKEATVMFGASSPDGRGNITAYLSYRNNEQVLQRDRDFSSCALGAQSTAAVAGVPAGAVHWTCGGSSTSFPGRFTDFGANAQNSIQFFAAPTPAQILANQTVANRPSFNFTVGGADRARPFSAATDQFNYGPLNFYQRPDERYTLGAFGRYEINDRAEAYTQLMFSDYGSFSQIAPSGNFFSTATINCDNPLLSGTQRLLACGNGVVGFTLVGGVAVPSLGADGLVGGVNSPGPNGIFGDNPLTPLVNEGLDDVLNADSLPCPDPDLVTPGNQCTATMYIGRRNVEGGGRQDDLRFQSFRTVVGLRGALNEAWNYDVFAQYARVQLSRAYLNDFSVTRLNRALDIVDADPGPGVTPQCRTGTADGCVPYNIFSLGGVTPAALAYLQIPLIESGSTTQQVVSASVTGDLGIASPAAESNFQAAFGIEYRRDELNTVTDENFTTGNASGQGGPTIGLKGVTDVLDLFGEMRLPLVENAAFADLISVDLAYRYSTYNTGVETDSYKLGADWAPTEDIRFRGSFQRAVRSANVIELFAAQGFNLFDMDDDPCDGTDPAADGVASVAACVGANPWQTTAGQRAGGGLTSPAGQYSFLGGGNPNLSPEESDTKTLGLVFQPSFIPGFTASVDWYSIELTQAVATTGSGNTVRACYFQADAASCARILRNPGSGQLWIGAGRVEDLNTNIGGLETTGIDLNVNYRTEIGGLGAVSFNLLGTWLDEFIVDPGAATGTAPYDCAGFYDATFCGTPSPELRTRFRVGWETPFGPELAATWRHYGEVSLFPGTSTTRIDRVFDAENYLDLAGNMQLSDNAKVRFGVNNVLDNDPPISVSVGTTGNGNTFPQLYDSLGRWVFAGVTVDF